MMKINPFTYVTKENSCKIHVLLLEATS